MGTQDFLASWSTLSFDEIEARVRAGMDQTGMEQLFGPEETAEMRELVAGPTPRGPREAVVLLPGIMGSLLTSIRGLTKLLWINPLLFLKGEFHYLELNEHGTADASPRIDAVAVGLEKIFYTKFALGLRRQADLYEFPYDWRRPIEANGDLLADSIERWADGQADRQFTLVGHSMGGLVSRAYLARHPQTAERRVQHLLMLGTPHFGAAETVQNLLSGNRMMALVAALNSRNVPRRLLLNLPSVYQILPAPPNLFPSHRPYPANWDLYRAADWHVEGIRQDYLDEALQFYQLLDGADPQVQTTQIAGCNLETTVEVLRSSGPDGQPTYDAIQRTDGPDAGDGTVPLWSAVLPGAAVYYIQQKHRSLPASRRVMEATLELIHGGTPDLPTDLPARKKELIPRGAPEPVALEAKRLRSSLEQGTASAEELSALYFAL
jgi:pimeloyl-ACP methyl ester carboxylesterase